MATLSLSMGATLRLRRVAAPENNESHEAGAATPERPRKSNWREVIAGQSRDPTDGCDRASEHNRRADRGGGMELILSTPSLRQDRGDASKQCGKKSQVSQFSAQDYARPMSTMYGGQESVFSLPTQAKDFFKFGVRERNN